jgi:hypothetical protein
MSTGFLLHIGELPWCGVAEIVAEQKLMSSQAEYKSHQ